MKEELLYHYTSIETLALILSNKSICFNNLLNVDDLEESKTNDMGLFGKFINVSCWTSDSEESIPLWNLYTPNMHGVRIGLPKFPFKRYHYKKGQYGLKEDVNTYINLDKVYNDNKATIVASMPEICEVEYTEDIEKLYPKIRTCDNLKGLKEFIDGKGNINFNVSYYYESLGKCKRKNWKFQNEVRYIIKCMPNMMKEFYENPSIKIYEEIIRRVENRGLPAPYDNFFLELNDQCFESLEIVLGPKVTEGEKIIIKALVDKYCSKYKDPKDIIRESNLKINKAK